VPYGVLKLGALTGDLAKALGWTQPPLTSFRLRNLVTEMVYDTRQLEEICGELPFSLEEGVRKTVAWMREPAPRAGLMPLPSGADARES
jgi:hypothetical protein